MTNFEKPASSRTRLRFNGASDGLDEASMGADAMQLAKYVRVGEAYLTSTDPC
jgi:hypothetical protein